MDSSVGKPSVEELKKQVFAEAECILEESFAICKPVPEIKTRRARPGSYDPDNLDEEDRDSWAG